MDPRADALRNGYRTIAAAYASHLARELDGKPLDRALLDVLAEMTREKGLVLDAGCGPGQIAAWLAARGAEVEGIDLSPEMIAEATRLHPALRFRVGDLFALPYADEQLAGAAAFYAIVHLPTDELLAPLRELHRVVRPGGVVLIAFHAGREHKHVDELWGCRTALDFVYHPPDQVAAQLDAAGFTITARLEREPYPDAEYPSRRCYLFAQRR
jgi:SAM-dependent methyltransferase